MEPVETKTIQIVVNGQEKQVAEGLSIATLLDTLGIDRQKVAVELNRSIVRKADWEKTPIENRAAVEVVWFVGGGSR